MRPSCSRCQSRFNAETQRNAEIRRGLFFSAFLRAPLRLCVKSSKPAGISAADGSVGLPEAMFTDSLTCVSTVVEIESAIQRLTQSEVTELAGWLSEYQQMIQASAEVFAMYDREEDRSEERRV